MKIIFKKSDNTIGIIHPTTEGMEKFGIDGVAEKATPTGRPYWIVEDHTIPTDRSCRDSWVLDGTEGEPDGYGE